MNNNQPEKLICRKCGACCFAPSISSPIPGMPGGKPAMTNCMHIDENSLCLLFNSPNRPKVCIQCMPDKEFCAENYLQAINNFRKAE